MYIAEQVLKFNLIRITIPPWMHLLYIYSPWFRDVREIKESEKRALSQAAVLRNALEEHGLELRVKAANEAQAACLQRLSAAESEIADLRAKLDAVERSCFWFLFIYLIRHKHSYLVVSDLLHEQLYLLIMWLIFISKVTFLYSTIYYM